MEVGTAKACLPLISDTYVIRWVWSKWKPVFNAVVDWMAMQRLQNDDYESW